MDEHINWDQEYFRVEELGIRGYKMQHFDVCKRVWTELVPKQGQADSVQGELLRQIEKLRNEACDNGNINWDDSFVLFFDFIRKTLEESRLFDAGHMSKIAGALEYIKENGTYAAQFAEGLIPDEDFDPIKLAYTESDLYDFISDAIAVFCMKNNGIIPHAHNPDLHR
ncbi:MAG: hypothetical protein PHP22_11315 [Oscillospiraceae bacterium]|nr:hypothetical protein [Oscillospiraceae bacterium]